MATESNVNNKEMNMETAFMHMLLLNMIHFILTACKVSIRSAPVILTAISLWEATLTVHWIGRVRVLDWFCV